MDSPEVVYPPLKRAADRALALALLVLLAPLLALALAAMGLDMLLCARDRGPFLYREQRVSGGRTFSLLKLRALRVEALARQQDGEPHARLLEADPQNLTWAGRRLLKPWYLDELPQLWNVLRGDMSLVGPRPWPPSMVAAQVAAGQGYRTRVPAGFTGPAQVRKDLTAPESYSRLDLEYVQALESWRPWRLLRYDLGLLWQTLKLLARGEGLRF
ncbi:MAG TPA: sugar transferase [Gaiellaceae bacterium]|nr:sugar transferase [Gaiellaceae bacterium]